MHENPNTLLDMFKQALCGDSQSLDTVIKIYEKHMVKLHEMRNVCVWFVHNGHVDSKYSVTAATIHCINEIDRLYTVARVVILLHRFIPGIKFIEYLV